MCVFVSGCEKRYMPQNLRHVQGSDMMPIDFGAVYTAFYGILMFLCGNIKRQDF